MNSSKLANNLLDEAIILATQAHCGQTDKAGAPYILHPLRVMLTQNDEVRRITAVLHDVVEDSDTSPQFIKERFGDTITDAIMALTRHADEDYETFILRCASNAIAIARDVKRADIEDNLDLSRLSSVSERDLARADKYRRALQLLDHVK